MQVIETVDGIRKALAAERAAGRTVGLVPTMGFLHAGHSSLMRRASAGCDVAAATIFVNPLQFAAGEDLTSYPRDIDHDRAVAEECDVAYLFTPTVEEMYGTAPVRTSVTVAEVGDGLEGAARPTHFAGVATVVAKLLNIAGPCRAYFGEKDWQQLQVVRRLVTDLSFPVEVVGCPTVREPDGVAMSSRNNYLAPDERRAATVLHRALLTGRAAAAAGDDPVGAMTEVVAAEPLAHLDYAAERDGRLLVAVRIGTTRLIDNMAVTAGTCGGSARPLDPTDPYEE